MSKKKAASGVGKETVSSRRNFDLSQLKWTLKGWQPFCWGGLKSMELGSLLKMAIGPLPAKVPGSVQQALRDADLLPDWTLGLNSLQCEWVENRHWSFQCTLPQEWLATKGCKVLRCEGLDHAGSVLLNGKEVGQFANAFVPHRFDLTPHLCAGDNELVIVFTDLPRSLGQIGYTSQIRDWKPRFNYGWDWVPRLVQIGVWDGIYLEVEDASPLRELRLFTQYEAATGKGSLMIHLPMGMEGCTLDVEVQDVSGTRIYNGSHELSQPTFSTGPFSVPPWQCNGNGEQPLFDVHLSLRDKSLDLVDEQSRRVGFRQITWKQCTGAPAGAEPWLCCINGVDTFLQGVNWVPLRPFFADVTAGEYRDRLLRYKDMGVNLLRVWGGAVLERELFYSLCDELGILVWQELPFSSSGLDNWPPEDPRVICEAADIARSYIVRRQHHPSLLLWCGGNELQGSLDGKKSGTGKPIDAQHPLMQAIGAVVRELDPDRRFLPTSSSGPRFMASAADFGKGLHHDVHGPWNHNGALESWIEYWDKDDALFRSETGFPGASPAEMIRRCAQGSALPADLTHALWRHVSSWWIQWEDYLKSGGNGEDLDAYVAWSQERQATALAYAARASKNRFPACGGFIVWMGHDCFPCPINTSILDVYGNPKPAATALARVFNAPGGIG